MRVPLARRRLFKGTFQERRRHSTDERMALAYYSLAASPSSLESKEPPQERADVVL